MRTLALRFSLVFIFTVPWETAFVGGLGSLSRTVGLAVAAFWSFTVLLTGRFRKPTLFHALAIVFLLWTAASVLWSLDLVATTERVISLSQIAILMVILWDLFTEPTSIRAGLQAYILGAYVIVVLLVLSYLKDPELGRYYVLRITANGTAVVLALGIPIAWYLPISACRNATDRVLKIVNYAYLPLALFCIALTATRFAMIMAVPGMLFGIASLSQLKIGYRVTIFILLCCILALLPSIVPERPLQRLGTINEEITSGNLNERTTFWKEGLHFWRQHPLLGIGGGAFENVSPSGRSMHNSFMAVLAELGLIGMALYGLIWMNAMYQAWDHPRWESWFWATLLVVLMIGNSALTMGHTKRSWLFFGLLTASWGASFVKGELEASTKEDPRYGPFTWLGASR